MTEGPGKPEPESKPPPNPGRPAMRYDPATEPRAPAPPYASLSRRRRIWLYLLVVIALLGVLIAVLVLL